MQVAGSKRQAGVQRSLGCHSAPAFTDQVSLFQGNQSGQDTAVEHPNSEDWCCGTPTKPPVEDVVSLCQAYGTPKVF